MPCYDKKLEASRQDFYNEAYSTRDVDCVLTTGELELLMREHAWDLSMPAAHEAALPSAPDLRDQLPELIAHPGTSSGSYLQSIIATLIARAPSSLALSVRAVRGADYAEHVLADAASGAVVFRGATCYGFRNLQNVVRKVGREAGVQVGRGAAGRLGGARPRAGRAGKKMDGAGGGGAEQERGYDYVEVMACPGGCVNGGGQLKPPARGLGTETADAEGYAREDPADTVGLPVASAKWGDREWTKRVEEAYWNARPRALDGARVRGDEADGVLEEADELAARILRDLCRPKDASEGVLADQPLTGAPDAAARWSLALDEEAAVRRRELFRTQYRAVESEVVGLAVKW